jgi:hypothetical protein
MSGNQPTSPDNWSLVNKTTNGEIEVQDVIIPRVTRSSSKRGLVEVSRADISQSKRNNAALLNKKAIEAHLAPEVNLSSHQGKVEQVAYQKSGRKQQKMIINQP